MQNVADGVVKTNVSAKLVALLEVAQVALLITPQSWCAYWCSVRLQPHHVLPRARDEKRLQALKLWCRIQVSP